MCGIAGLLGNATLPQLRAMARAMAHRGPDGEGFFFDAEARIGLAHRRLAIIDPTSAASQPMESCNGRYQVVFNGEIYNFRELAAELRQAGYTFNYKSDTAVLGPLYDKYGPSGFQRLNGIFAFALWDTEKRELVAVRDAFGVKPFYYFHSPAMFAFASEIKALLALGLGAQPLDHKAILDYLVYLWSPGAKTPFANVRKLLPGHFLHLRSGIADIERWHTPPIGGGPALEPLGAASAKQSLRIAFDQAVAGQCLSDVPVGAFLSGGVDSSAIVASMVASGNRPEKTYCIGFTGPSMQAEGFGDDLSHARIVANYLRVPLTEVQVGEIEASDLEKLPFILDEPEADPAALYVAKIAEAARADGIKVLLGGTGADDIFSGYRRHRAAALRARFGEWLQPLLSKVPAGQSGSSPFARRLAKLAYIFEGKDEQFLLRAFEFNRRDLALRCLSPQVAGDSILTSGGWLEYGLTLSRGHPLLDRMLHLELMGFLPDHNLNYTDKAGMAHGVEVRVPFLDTGLANMAARIPWQLKTRGISEKMILKQAFSDRLPQAVLNRRKTGFGAPVRAWFAQGGLKSLAADVFASRRFRERGLFNVQEVQSLLKSTADGREDGSYLLLAIITIEHWLQRFADAPQLEPANNS